MAVPKVWLGAKTDRTIVHPWRWSSSPRRSMLGRVEATSELSDWGLRDNGLLSRLLPPVLSRPWSRP